MGGVNIYKILVFGFYTGIGGVEEYIMNLYRHIDRNKIKMDFVIEGDSSCYETEIKKLGGEIFFVTPKRENLLKNINEYHSLKKVVCKYDFLYFNFSVLYYIYPFYIYSIKNKTKIISHAHNIESNFLNKLYKFSHKFNRKVINRCSNYKFACSVEAGEWIFGKKAVRNHLVEIKKNAINLNDFKFNEEIRETKRKEIGVDQKIVIGNTGRFTEQKNQKFAVKIFDEIYKKNKNVTLLLIGDGPLKKGLEDETKFLSVYNNIKFLGERTDVNELLQAMDFFLFPSTYEGFGIALIEAQAAGLMCLASKDVIPKAAQVTPLLEFKSLEDGEEAWSNRILEMINTVNNYDRNGFTNLLEKNGYSIDKTAEDFSTFILKQCEGEKSV